MNTKPSESIELVAGASMEGRGLSARRERALRAESMQATGKKLIFAGFVITIVGVVAYCAACFAGGTDVDMQDLLLRNAVPFAHGTLAVLGFGTLVWLVGSFTYLRGATDADADAAEGTPPSGE